MKTMYLLIFIVGNILLSQTSFTQQMPFMKPVIKKGRYYYSEDEKEITMGKVFASLSKKGYKVVLNLAQNLIIKIGLKKEKEEEEVLLRYPLPKALQTIPQKSTIEPVLTWIGHATFLIQVGGFNILTDPLFGDVYAGSLHITDRIVAPGICLKDLPPIDAIVISHNHADHTDKRCLAQIYAQNPAIKILIPTGNLALFRSMGIKAEAIVENTWWDEYTLKKDDKELVLTFLPARHWSIYISPFGFRKSIWGSWMISCNQKNIYFAGDTGYGPHFKQIAQKFNSIDVALMPIAPTYKDLTLSSKVHINAKEAIDAFIDLNAFCLIPMHWGTVFKGPSSVQYPINGLCDYWRQQKQDNNLKDKKLLLVPDWGQPYNLETYTCSN